MLIVLSDLIHRVRVHRRVHLFLLHHLRHSADDGRWPQIRPWPRGIYLCLSQPLSRHHQLVSLYPPDHRKCEKLNNPKKCGWNKTKEYKTIAECFDYNYHYLQSVSTTVCFSIIRISIHVKLTLFNLCLPVRYKCTTWFGVSFFKWAFGFFKSVKICDKRIYSKFFLCSQRFFLHLILLNFSIKKTP